MAMRIISIHRLVAIVAFVTGVNLPGIALGQDCRTEADIRAVAGAHGNQIVDVAYPSYGTHSFDRALLIKITHAITLIIHLLDDCQVSAIAVPMPVEPLKRFLHQQQQEA